MAAKQSNSKPAAAKRNGGNGNGKPASKRPQYGEDVVAIATKARAMANPETKQGPVPKQVADTMRVLKDPREALKEAGLTQKEVKATATGNGDKEAKAKLRPLAARVREAGGAPQWTSGRPLAATLVAWLEQS
jgi:hypothetical protein